MSLAFLRQLTVTASTKRNPAIASGKRSGTTTTQIASLKVSPLDPVSAELRNRLDIDTPHELLQCFTKGSHAILEGDILVVAGLEYPIKAVADWPDGTLPEAFKQLILEDLKR